MRRNFFVLVACACALVVAACGSKSAGNAAQGTGAEIAPADSIVFVSIDVDQAIRHWQKSARLLDLVTGLSGFERLAGGACLRSLPSVLGKQIGVAVLGAEGGAREGVVVITRPANASSAKRALGHGIGAECTREIAARVRPAQSARKSSRPVLRHATREIDGWLLISDSAATLDRFEREAKSGTLAASSDFRSAFAALPGDAAVRVYLSREAISIAIADLGFVPGQLAAKIRPAWVAVAARPVAGGFRLDGAVSGVEAVNAPNSSIGEAPATSRLALSFNGSSYGLDETVQKLSGERKTGLELARVERYLGLKPDELAALARGEIIGFADRLEAGGEDTVAVDPQTGKVAGLAGLGLELRGQGASSTARKIEKGLPALASYLEGGAQRVSLNGVGAEELTLGALRFFVAGAGGRMFLSTSPNLIGYVPTLSSSAVFRAARRALGLPARNAGILFADLVPRTGKPVVSRKPNADRIALLVYLDASRSPLRIGGVLVIG